MDSFGSRQTTKSMTLRFPFPKLQLLSATLAAAVFLAVPHMALSQAAPGSDYIIMKPRVPSAPPQVLPGVLITGVRDGSPAANAGLDSGMVIVQINKKPVRSVEEARTFLTDEAVQKGVLLLVKASEGTKFVVLRVE